jgi:predicted Rossmann-fold nucleotide-binding protein
MERNQFEIKKEIEDTPERRVAFRVSIFGTSGNSGEQGEIAASLAERLAKDIVVSGGHKVVNGGGAEGVMGGASQGAKEAAQNLGREDLFPEGIVIGDSFGKTSEDAKIEKTDSLNKRLKRLIDDSKACVVLYGKMGTAQELLDSMIYSAVESMSGEEKKPVIIADQSLEHLDLLAFLSKADKKRFPKFAENTFVVSSSDAGLEETNKRISADINFIIEASYKQSLGQELSEQEKEKLVSLSLNNFIKATDNFEQGGGI